MEMSLLSSVIYSWTIFFDFGIFQRHFGGFAIYNIFVYYANIRILLLPNIRILFIEQTQPYSTNELIHGVKWRRSNMLSHCDLYAVGQHG